MTVKQTEAFLRHQLEKDQERHASNDPTEQPILRFKLEDIGRQSDDDDKSDDDIDGDAETYNCGHDLDRTNDDLARGSLEGVEDAEIFVIQDSSFDLKAADYLSSRSLRSGRTIRTWRSVKTRATRSHSFSHATTSSWPRRTRTFWYPWVVRSSPGMMETSSIPLGGPTPAARPRRPALIY